MPDLKGSPPLTRGIPGNIKTLGGATRFTPAHAGNTLPHLPDRRLSQVHPRSRGEYTPICSIGFQRFGSPPLTRGIPEYAKQNYDRCRFTPAHAGNTLLIRFIKQICRVHPRSRGEYPVKEESAPRYKGSPPLTRGILIGCSLLALRVRFTPAHAGNTLLSCPMARNM